MKNGFVFPNRERKLKRDGGKKNKDRGKKKY